MTKVFAIALFVFLFTGVVVADSTDKYCDTMFAEIGDYIEYEWVGYEQGGWLISAIKDSSVKRLSSTYFEYSSGHIFAIEFDDAPGFMYAWFLFSEEITRNSDGILGNHDICPSAYRLRKDDIKRVKAETA